MASSILIRDPANADWTPEAELTSTATPRERKEASKSGSRLGHYVFARRGPPPATSGVERDHATERCCL